MSYITIYYYIFYFVTSVNQLKKMFSNCRISSLVYPPRTVVSFQSNWLTLLTALSQSGSLYITQQPACSNVLLTKVKNSALLPEWQRKMPSDSFHILSTENKTLQGGCFSAHLRLSIFFAEGFCHGNQRGQWLFRTGYKQSQNNVLWYHYMF